MGRLRIIIGLVCLAYLFFYLFGSAAFSNIEGMVTKSIANGECPKGIVGDRFELSRCDEVSCYLSVGGNQYKDYSAKWADGSQMNPYSICNRGNKAGQNTNYIYCNNLGYESTPVSSSGTIGKTVKYKISLILDSKDSVDVVRRYMDGWNEYSIHQKQYKVISSSCS